jgi:hypothetical protein
LIGSKCEALHRTERARRDKLAEEAYLATFEALEHVREKHQHMRKWTVKQRRASDPPEIETVDEDLSPHQETRRDVEKMLCEISGPDPGRPLGVEPHYSIPRGKRPYGVRWQILNKVARWASRRFKKRITPRYVDKCWKEFREMERATQVIE